MNLNGKENLNFFEAQAEFARNRVPFALCTVIERKGSAPAKPGAKMIVATDGKTIGTIGGAELEYNVTQMARELLLQNSPPVVKEFSLFYKKENGMDLACGGTVSVFIEAIFPPPNILICGGGHVGLALAKIFDVLSYSYSVCDNRTEYRSQERFPNAANHLESFPEDPQSFDCMIVATYGQDLDYKILLQAYKTKYAGPILLIGSKAKWNDFSRRLKKDDIADGFLEQIQCPAGLPIKTVSVGEIAISLAGWIVDHCRNEMSSCDAQN